APDCPVPQTVASGRSFDWDSFFAEGLTTDSAGTAGTPGGVPSVALPHASRPDFLESVFVKDFVTSNRGLDHTTFSTGSKDVHAIQGGGADLSGNWQCDGSNNVLDKDNLINTYALAYSAPDGPDAGSERDLVVYAGLERSAVQGTADAAFWLLKDSTIGCTDPPGGGAINFTGNHQTGDILIVAEYTSGGRVAFVRGFRWEGGATGCLDSDPTALPACDRQPIFTGSDCKIVTGADSACATVNGDPNFVEAKGAKAPNFPVDPPWSAEYKNGTAIMDTPQFLEAGLNLSALGVSGCFSKILADTRSSASLTATIFDYTLGAFELCDANISITPSATNEVGTDHQMTVTVQKQDPATGFVLGPAAGVLVTGSLSNANGATASFVGGNTCTTDALGQCTLTINSPTAGQTTVNASATVTFTGGETKDVTTNGLAGNSGPVVKTWVDARITITPDDTNEVGQPHTFTVDVEQNAGDGAGFVAATVGDVDFTLTNSNGAAFALNAAASTCDDAGDNLDAAGQCTIVFTSASAGKVTGNASVSLSVGGVALTRDTDPATAAVGAGPGGSGPAVKTFVDARITITPTATNEVGTEHVFTITVAKNAGDGAGFVAAAGVFPTTSVSPAPDSASSNCAAGTNASGQCTLTINSSTAGVFTANAYVTFSVGGVSLTRDTDPATAAVGAGPGGSGPAVKTYVDARITITPNDTNGIGESHTFVVDVDQNDGTGFVAATVGNVDVTLTNAGGAAFVLNAAASTCDDAQPAGDNLDASGQCIVVFTSATAGTVTGNASVILSVGGLSLTRDTDPATAAIGAGPGGSGPAVKIFVDGSLRWEKRDSQTLALLGGATFEYCRTHTLDSSTDPDSYVDTADVCVSVTDNSAPDADPTDGEFLIEDLILGRYTVRETAAPPGYTIDNPNPVTAPDMTLAAPDVAIAQAFLDTPPLEGCTPGFWQGGTGANMWNEDNDPQWPNNPATTNPFIHTTPFDPFFQGLTGVNSTLSDTITMFDLVSTGGGPTLVQKTARMLVAAYLNSLAGINFGITPAQLQAGWAAFVSGGETDATFFNTLSAANNRDCPLGSASP
ncbi:MAG TPA: prealbumin-like fold domain-containing protein, partial [Acidimicrobiia bacterium]|nr:prealbumin-like fold domain-containing protein [Acidimicrobiia bacterium]